jgi:hypothetical protein
VGQQPVGRLWENCKFEFFSRLTNLNTSYRPALSPAASIARNHCFAFRGLSFASCGKGELRTPKYENQKSCFCICLEFASVNRTMKFSRKSNTENRLEKSLYYQPLIFWRRGGIILTQFSQLRLFLSLHSQYLHFLSLKAESQQSYPSQQCPPVSPMDIESAQKK